MRLGKEQESAWFSVFKVAQAEAEMAVHGACLSRGTLGSSSQYLGPKT